MNNKRNSYQKELEQIRTYNPGATLGKFTKIKICRACHGKNVHRFLSFGLLPKPNGFLSRKHLKSQESYYPLDVVYCSTCGMVQLEELVSPDEMFSHYVYASAASAPMVEHLREFADTVVSRLSLTKDDLVLDVGSNDGTLLSFFQTDGTRILGIDPAKNIAKEANKAGIPTIVDFFSYESAKQIKEKYGLCTVITAANVVAHTPDWDSLFQGMKLLLSRDGVCIIEFPYLLDTLRTYEFDTMYHEHLAFISLHSLSVALNRSGLEIFDLEHFSIHGGSLRVFATHQGKKEKSEAVCHFLNEEDTIGITKPEIYEKFAQHVMQIRMELEEMLTKLHAQGKKIIAYGATAKGNVLLNFCHVHPDLIEAIVDSTPFKQGLYAPGTHIPVVPEAKIDEISPDYAVLTAWNFTDAILAKNEARRQKGLKFIRPYPRPVIL